MLSDCTAPFLIHFHTDATADAITPARGELSSFELNGGVATSHCDAIPIDAVGQKHPYCLVTKHNIEPGPSIL